MFGGRVVLHPRRVWKLLRDAQQPRRGALARWNLRAPKSAGAAPSSAQYRADVRRGPQEANPIIHGYRRSAVSHDLSASYLVRLHVLAG